MEQHGMGSKFTCPALPHGPEEAIGLIEEDIGRHAASDITFVGSSLGGYYATWLAEKHGRRAVLINPAITPHTGLRSFLGKQQNLYSGAIYELTAAHLAQMEQLSVREVTPQRYLLLVETGDELLDYREAVQKYHGCTQVVVKGRDHTLASFPEHIPRILTFAGMLH